MNIRELQRVAGHLTAHGVDHLTLRQISALIVLAEAPTGEMDFTDLRKGIGLPPNKKPSVTRAMDTLGKCGLATRFTTEDDKRRRVCAITPKGREVVKSLGEAA